MYNNPSNNRNSFWYENKDKETQDKLNKIFHQKRILHDAVVEKKLTRSINNIDVNNDPAPQVKRKLF